MFSDDDSSKTPRNDSIISHLTGYLDTRIDLIRLEAQQKLKEVFITVAHSATLAVLGIFFLIFLSVFGGLALNSALDSAYWGFGIIAGIYLLLLILVLVGVDKTAFQGLADKLFKDTIYKSDKRQD